MKKQLFTSFMIIVITAIVAIAMGGNHMASFIIGVAGATISTSMFWKGVVMALEVANQDLRLRNTIKDGLLRDARWYLSKTHPNHILIGEIKEELDK